MEGEVNEGEGVGITWKGDVEALKERKAHERGPHHTLTKL
jgi:hypothetical protein